MMVLIKGIQGRDKMKRKELLVAICFAAVSLVGYANVESVSVSDVSDVDTSTPLAQLTNEHLEVVFVSAQRAGVNTVVPMMRTQGASGWQELPLTSSAESYQVLKGFKQTKLNGTKNKYHLEWSRQADSAATITVNGVTVAVDSLERSKNVVWDAGVGEEFIPSGARQVGANRIELDFHRGDSGVFTAVWELLPGARSAKISMNFVPDASGQYSLGYFPPFEKEVNQVEELLMPPIVHRKRFPSDSFTVVSGSTPTPVSLMQVAGHDGPVSLGVIAAAEMIPQGFPTPADSHFGLHIRSPRGLVQPSIYGPLVGTSGSSRSAGSPVSMSLHLLAEPGDWYAGYRVAADEVLGWRDYRQNGQVSGTDAVLNMIDLYKDDWFGGWWNEGKGFYQIEGHNSVTHSAPLLAPSLYRLTADRTLYETRTCPTLAYMLSRDDVHFSPIREGARNIMLGSMEGPVRKYGTTVFGALDQLLDGRMPVFRETALSDGGIKSNATTIDEFLGHYMLTGDQTALQEAIDRADQYIAQVIENPPSTVLSISSFFLIQYTPSWEVFLQLYEVTGETLFLDAAVFGARQVMTGMWTQRMPSEDALITIHPGRQIDGDKMRLTLHKGSGKFRLGFPIRDGDIVEKQVPEWLVSPVGLGLEQPSTYSYREQGGRLIQQNNWAPGFLRLAHYTGDTQFATYARNASVGRAGNYPGYYYTTYTDLQQDPNFPYEGPDVGFIYYHHLPVHLMWWIDYLVSDAFYLSEGAVHFPGLRQFGYAYFDNLVYGHAPGEVFGHTDAWLWFRRGLVELDNPQINHLTAHDGSRFFAILTNQSREEQTVDVKFNPAEISPVQGDFATAVIINDGDRSIPLVDAVATVTLPPRGIVALRVDGLDIDVPTHRTPEAPGAWVAQDYLEINSAGVPEFRAASVQAESGPWDAFVWCTALPAELQDFKVVWVAGSESGSTEVDDVYPFEVTIPVKAGVHAMSFHVEGTLPDGSSFITETHSIGVAP
jgi:hypothetical protein